MDILLKWVPYNNKNILYQTVQYKKTSDTTWIEAVRALPVINQYTITGLLANTQYDFRIGNNSTYCGTLYGTVVTKITDDDEETIWIKDSWYCETSNPFAITQSYTGYLSPISLGFIDDVIYVVDIDESNHIFYVAPSELSTSSAVKHSIAGTTIGTVYAGAVDETYKKVYYTGYETYTDGFTTGGLVYYDLSSTTPSLGTISFGTEQTYNKLSLSILDTQVISIDSKTQTNNILTVDRSNIGSYSIKSTSSIATTNNSTYTGAISQLISGELLINQDTRGNIIILSKANASYMTISVFSSDLTVLLQVIDLLESPYSATVGPSGKYRASIYYDKDSDFLYLYEYGTSKLHRFAYSSENYSLQTTYQYPVYSSRWLTGSIKSDSITNDLYLTGTLNITESSIVADSYKSYKFNKSTLVPEYILVNQSISDLVKQDETSTLWGVNSRTTYSTTADGEIFKIER